jgi:hypothetical protein
MANFDVHITGVHEDDVPNLEQICADACIQAIEDYYSVSSDSGATGPTDGSELDPSSVGGY